MKPIITMLLALVLALLLVPAAQAAQISDSYCVASLRGQTSQAPDNDIKQRWDAYEANTVFNIVSSYWVGPAGAGPSQTYEYWRFIDSGFGAHNDAFVCYRSADGVYHDRFEFHF